MFIRFQRCVGVMVWRWKRTQVEVWFCPRGELVPPHSHRGFDSLIVHLAGRMVFWAEGRGRVLNWGDVGWSKLIPAGAEHGLIVRGPFGVFVNFETWKHDGPTSAVDDFILPGGTR